MAADERPMLGERVVNARPDTLDFRDQMYVPTLVEVAPVVDLDEYRSHKIPVLDQGREGACTGFGLATVANYLLARRRVRPDRAPVSPRMLYEMARRYDEWPGEDYEGSSARGAMKGWHKHGVCSATQWPYSLEQTDGHLSDERVADAARRPLGAYFRVNHTDLVAMHAALAEVGILYATAMVHRGWEEPGADGVIPLSAEVRGGHAFAVVAYDERGFWIQNSWAEDWGHDGFALVTYDDWLMHATDVWAARLGVPLVLQSPTATAVSHSAGGTDAEAYSYRELRPHLVTLGNDGRLSNTGVYGTTRAHVEAIIRRDIPARTKSWAKRRLLLYAHGGLVSEGSLVQRVADHRATMLGAEVYPLAFNWRSDFGTTVRNILQDALSRRRPEGFLDAAKDFMLDRLDDALEPLARKLGGKAAWDEMKENARLATERNDGEGGVRLVCELVAELVEARPGVDVHLVGHSAGSVLLAPLVQLLAGRGVPVTSCTLWAPACTVALFKETYLPAIRDGGIERFALFTLSDTAEQDDDCANLYNKSLLYLVANAFEDRPRVPLFRGGVPLLGMERFVRADADLMALFDGGRADWVRAPNDEPDGSARASRADRHGGFNGDAPTLRATLARVLAEDRTARRFRVTRTESGLRDQRRQLTGAGPARFL